MSPITKCIKENDTRSNPIWLMRQAGRYLPEFREIRRLNQDFIKLCLNSDLASEITLQPIKRFGFDGAVIFSDILMLPYGLGQKVEFEKNFGPKLGDINLEKIKNIDEINFTEKVYKVYKAISKTSKDPLMNNRDMIGFVGAPWTILVYMINKSSPKKGLSNDFFKDDFLINRLLGIIEKFLKFHIKNQDTKTNPIWLMRQAGRYLPEFREIRKENQDFIKLCLNSDLASEITLQPIKRFGFDGAVIFSDILMLPYGLGQNVEFEKNFGPKLGNIDLEKIKNIDEINFTEKIYKVYKAIEKTSKDPLMNNRDMIGFVGAPWTILVYMINKSSPKKGLSNEFFKDDFFINRLLGIIEKFLKLHIKNQIEAGAQVIQIFDSWAG